MQPVTHIFLPDDSPQAAPNLYLNRVRFPKKGLVEVGEAGSAVDDAMRRQRRVQLVG